MSKSETPESASPAPGTVKPAELVKAGCGFRFDPDTLSGDTGFNFDAARELLEQSRQAAEPQGETGASDAEPK